MKAAVTLIACLLLSCYTATAQEEEVTFNVGGYITLGNCPTNGTTFTAIDQYIKTRFEQSVRTYNKETGAGFYEYFFLNGDFDAARLPCSFAGKKVRIVAIQAFEDKDTKQIRDVFLCQPDNNPNMVVWIEIDKAVDAGEIAF